MTSCYGKQESEDDRVIIQADDKSFRRICILLVEKQKHKRGRGRGWQIYHRSLWQSGEK